MNRKFLAGLFVVAFLVGLSPISAWADDLPNELRMKTDVGEVVIQIAECPLKNIHGFEYAAYATDNSVATKGHPEVHLGCWKKDGDVVSIWFYNEPQPPVASYKDYHFKP